MNHAARFISFWTGFCSLSLEVAWVRLYGYANQSTPQAFGFVLAVYLLGIALGAQWGKRVCRTRDRSGIERASVVALTVAAMVAVIAPWAYLHSGNFMLDDIAAPAGIMLTAAALSVLFPITHHLGTLESTGVDARHKGQRFSRVYMLNVAGAALGPLLTGYVLLDLLTITQLFAVLGGLVAVTALISLYMQQIRLNWRLGVLAFTAFVLPAFALWAAILHPHAFAKSFAEVGSGQVHLVHENRHGIITISRDAMNDSEQASIQDFSVYGGNVYDGKVNVSLERNTNGLHRPLAMHVLQPKAKRVLVLGLSIGSWLTVVEGFPGVEQIDVVEINPGYLTLAKSFAAQSRALRDSRVRVHIDDARRWLQYHPEQRYDLILMNTTWHWRANSTMLLSVEMMQLLRRHLTSQGVVAFNATGSLDAFYSATKTFSYTRRYDNFVYAADWDCFTPAQSSDAWKTLSLVTVDGTPAFSAESKQIQKFSKIPFVDIQRDIAAAHRPPEVVTDNNMLVEYKFGRR